MLIATGATDVSIDVQIVDDTGLPVTGLVAATFPTIKFSRGTGADVTLTLSDLASVSASHSDGGVKERGEGVYRLDLPDTAGATAGEVTLRGEATGKRLIASRILVDATVASRLAGSAYVPSTITPLSAGDIQRVVGTEIQVFQGEAITHTVASITDVDGNAVTLTGKTLEVVIDRVVDLRTGSHTDLEVVQATVVSANTISFTNTVASTATVGNVFRWALREPSNGNYVWARGVWNVLSAATEDT